MSEKVLIIFFINKETEAAEKKKIYLIFTKNIKIASLFTRSEYSTSYIGI